MTTRSRRWIWAFCMPVFAGLACGGGGSSVGADISIDDFATEGEIALCDYFVRCGGYPDSSTCMAGSFTRLQAVADVKAGKILYDGHGAAECLDGYASLGCNGSDFAADPTKLAACSTFFKGTVALGGICLMDAECVSQSCNLTACNGVSCCAGACQEKIASGGDCSPSGVACVDGTYCKRGTSSATATCVVPSALGQPCLDSFGCARGTGCDIDPATNLGTCIHPPAEGQSCHGSLCDSSGDFCDPTTNKCVRKSAAGGACTSTSGCVLFAPCDLDTKTCVSGAPLGGACKSSSDCISDLPCQNDVCGSRPDEPACP